MTELSNPHDHFFRELLSRQEAARDFLRYYLPAEVAALLDLSAPKLLPDSFIDPELREHSSDLLYQVALREGGSPAYIYILFEHKSYPDPLVAFQLLRYMVRIWERDQNQGTKLASIMPVVLYHGEARWRIAPNLQAIFQAPAELAPYLPDYRYWLCDLSQYSDEQIKGEMILQVGLLTLKYILRDDLREHLVDILSLFRQLSQQQTGLEYLETVLRYLAGGTSKITDEELWKAVATAFPKGEALVGTIAEKWVEQGKQLGLKEGLQQGELLGLKKGRQEGRQEGEQLGLKKGRQEGRQEGEQLGLKKGEQKGKRQTTLKNLRQILTIRFDAPRPDFEHRLEPLDLPALEELITASLTLPSWAEFEQAVDGALAAQGRLEHEGAK
jgi:predicted transposase/invertase (TIGR01784 family)